MHWHGLKISGWQAPHVVGLKNWLFFISPGTVIASSTMFSGLLFGESFHVGDHSLGSLARETFKRMINRKNAKQDMVLA